MSGDWTSRETEDYWRLLKIPHVPFLCYRLLLFFSTTRLNESSNSNTINFNFNYGL